MSDKIYDTISFRTYQIDRPRDPDRIYSKDFEPDENHPEEFVYTKSYLDGKLPTLAKLACEYAFNKNLERYSSKPPKGDYNVCITFTKHFLCICFCWEKSSKTMYFVDIDVDLPNSTQEQIRVNEIKAYKLTSNGVPCLNLISEEYTVGFVMGEPNSSRPYKLPIIGISEKKVFLPRLSFFLEGPHINLYKQNYLLDYAYGTSNDSAYNKTTENVSTPQPVFNQYQFRIPKPKP